MKKNKKVAYLNVFHIITNFVIFSICVLFVPSFLFESKIVYRSFGGFFRYPNDINSSSDTYVSQMNLDKAWDIATGFDLYTIGVIDSGINNSSLDLLLPYKPNSHLSLQISANEHSYSKTLGASATEEYNLQSIV